MRFAPRTLLILSCLIGTLARAGELKVGDVAPPLTIAKYVKGPADTAFKKGEVYLVEFWATWCTSCHASFPHLNELAKAVQGKPVHIVAISEESEAKVASFLQRKP